ncbi:MAG: hypothetical protein GX811_01875 [Lentisphaerae bacterium]|nr:hypothetical protein [Lentisphaerota bacterium]
MSKTLPLIKRVDSVHKLTLLSGLREFATIRSLPSDSQYSVEGSASIRRRRKPEAWMLASAVGGTR